MSAFMIALQEFTNCYLSLSISLYISITVITFQLYSLNAKPLVNLINLSYSDNMLQNYIHKIGKVLPLYKTLINNPILFKVLLNQKNKLLLLSQL